MTTKAEATRATWRDPACRARRTAGLLRAWEDPLFYAARMSELRERMRKLSDEQIVAIRRRYVPRDPVNSAYAMAREFEVHPNTVFKINKESV